MRELYNAYDAHTQCQYFDYSSDAYKRWYKKIGTKYDNNPPRYN